MSSRDVKPELVVAAVQPPCVPYDVAANARVHADAVRSAGARVNVLVDLAEVFIGQLGVDLRR